MNSESNKFSVAIIPYTFQHTNFHKIKKGTVVNLEFDIFGKYIAKMLNKNINMKPTLLILAAGMGSRYGGLKTNRWYWPKQ